MTLHISFSSLLYFSAAFVSLGVSIYFILRRLHVVGAANLIMLLLTISLWALSSALLDSVDTARNSFFWSWVKNLGEAFLPIAWLFFVLQYTRLFIRMPRWQRYLLGVPPVLSVVLPVLASLAGWPWQVSAQAAAHPGSLQAAWGPLGSLFAIVDTLYYAAAAGLLLRELFLAPRQKKLPTLFLLATFLPVGLGPLSLIVVTGVPPHGLAPLVHSACLALFLYTLFHFRLLNVVPIAFQAMIGGMGDGMIVLDMDDQVTHLNPAAEQIAGIPLHQAIGKPIEWLVDQQPALRQAAAMSGDGECLEITLPSTRGQVFYEVTHSPLRNRNRVPIGRMILFRDITGRIRTEEATRRSQDMLHQSEETYRQLVENISEVIFSLNLDWEVTYISPVIERSLDYPPAEMVGKKLEHFLHPESCAELHQFQSQALAGASFTSDLRFYDRGGMEHILRASGHCYSSGGRPAGIQGMMTDITEYRRVQDILERRAAQLALLNEIGEQISAVMELERVLDSATRLIRANFGYYHVALFVPDFDKRELVMRSAAGDFASVFPAYHRIKFSEGIIGWVANNRSLLLANDIRQEPRYKNFFPEKIFTQSELAVPVLLYDDLIGVLDVQSPRLNAFDENDIRVIRNIASQIAIAISNARLYEQVRYQLRETARLYNEVDRARSELEQRAAALESANERLRELDRIKSQFLANMSHELRTPLNSIIGFSELLIDGAAGPLPEDQKEYMGDIYESGRHLLALINDLLDFSKIEAGQMALEYSPFDIRDLFNEVKPVIQPLVDRKNQSLAFEIEPGLPPVTADRLRLRQVFVNLLSNANKFSPEMGSIVVRCCAEPPGQVRFLVKDNGIGIRPEDFDLIFEEFRQADGSLTREVAGTGLGLAISKRIIDLHRGRIWVESEVGQGSSFYICLPIHPPADMI